MGLAKDVSSYNESALRSKECFSITCLQTPLSSSGEQRGGSPYASRKPPRCHQSRGYVGLSSDLRVTETQEGNCRYFCVGPAGGATRIEAA